MADRFPTDKRQPDSSVVRPFLWEGSYPQSIHWNSEISICSLGEFINRSAVRHSDRMALAYREAELSYRELADLILRVGVGLLRINESASGIGLLLPNTLYQPILLFGAMSAGRHVIQLSPLDSPRELAFKFRDTGARVLVTLAAPDLVEKALMLRADGLVDRIIFLDDERWGARDGPCAMPDSAMSFEDLVREGRLDAPISVDVNQPAIIQFTGGTTGSPKGAILSHRNIVAAAGMATYWQSVRGMGLRDRVLMVLPLFHIFGLTMLNRHLGDGNSVLLRQRFDPQQCLEDLEIFEATTVNCVPTMWTAIANESTASVRNLSSLSYPTSGGAPLPVEVARRVEGLTGIKIFPGWGMTETAGIGCQHSPTGEVRDTSIGLPLPGFEVQIVDLKDRRRLLGVGETGEIRVKGPNVFQGYWNRPEENEIVFVDGFFLTGDIGRMDEDGFVYLTDRKKDMIISSGYNVYPSVIENAIYEHPAVAECIVIGIPDSYRGQAAKAYVSLKVGASVISYDELKVFLKDRIGRHEMPVALEIRERLPRTSVGKLSRLEMQKQSVGQAPTYSE